MHEEILSKQNKKIGLTIITLSSFLVFFMASSINIAIPDITKEFQLNAMFLNWIVSSYLLATTIFLVPVSRLADIYGRKKVFILGLGIFIIASILSAISFSFWFLLMMRLLHGLGSAMVFSTGIPILASLFSSEERGKILGINASSVYFGLAAGPFLGGYLVSWLGWRSIFFINIPFGLIAWVLVIWKLKGEWVNAKHELFDVIGSILLMLAIIFLICGFSFITSYFGFILIGAGILGFTVFIRWELRFRSPIIPINLFIKNKVFVFSNIATLISYCSAYAIAFLFSLYLQYIKKLSPQDSGSLLIIQPIFMAIFSPIAGKMSDKIEPRLLASFGLILTAVSLILSIFLTSNSENYYILITLMILGTGVAFFASPNNNAIMSSVEVKHFGIASAMVGMMRMTGQMLSMAIVMVIFALFIGEEKISPEKYPSFLKSIKILFSIFTLLSLLGIFASLVRGKLRGTDCD